MRFAQQPTGLVAHGWRTLALLVLSSPGTVRAAEYFDLGSGATLRVGWRIQAHAFTSDPEPGDVSDEGAWSMLNLRRARVRLKATINPWLSARTNIEPLHDEAPWFGPRVVSARVRIKARPWFVLELGEGLIPSGRQNMSSSAAFMSIDRPAIAYKALTWGTRAKFRFTHETLSIADAGLRGDFGARDVGAILWGDVTLRADAHAKYYVSVSRGLQPRGVHLPRFAARLQFNLFDPEPGYTVRSTYLGAKQTFALGVSYDGQTAVDYEMQTGRPIDYHFWSGDVFLEQPMTHGVLTVQAAASQLFLDQALSLASSARDARVSAGHGFFVQAGYYFAQEPFLQPWAEYERWEALHWVGSFNARRVGLNYYLDGYGLNLRAAYERVQTAFPPIGRAQSHANTILVAFHTTG